MEFEMNAIAYYEGHNLELEEKLLLKYAIFDLLDVENDEHWDEMPYNETLQTQFQKLIRYGKDKLSGPPKKKQLGNVFYDHYSLYDHRPLELNNDDSEHVCEIPKKRSKLQRSAWCLCPS